MKKKDLILIAALLLIALAGLLAVKLLQSREGSRVLVQVNGEVIAEFSLDEDVEYSVDNDFGHNVIVIRNGEVDMKEADCRDLVCVKHAPVKYNHEAIICLPHKLVVEVSGGKESGIDASLD